MLERGHDACSSCGERAPTGGGRGRAAASGREPRPGAGSGAPPRSGEMRFSINCSIHDVLARDASYDARAAAGARLRGARWAAAIASNGRRVEIYRGVSFRALMELVLRFCLYSRHRNQSCECSPPLVSLTAAAGGGGVSGRVALAN